MKQVQAIVESAKPIDDLASISEGRGFRRNGRGDAKTQASKTKTRWSSKTRKAGLGYRPYFGVRPSASLVTVLTPVTCAPVGCLRSLIQQGNKNKRRLR